MNKYKNVTLYIPCYNADKYIAECLEGILKQTYPIDEILIIDDGSTDKTVEIASKYSVKIIHHGINKGLAAARNTAFKNAKNEYVAALDADCVPESDWLEKLMENFTGESIAGVGGKLIEKYTDTLADKWRAVHMKQHWGDERIVNPDFLFGSNNVFLKKAVEGVGYLNERFRTNYEDVDICKRLKERGYILIYEPEAIIRHLLNDSILSVLNRAWRWGFSGGREVKSVKILVYRVVKAYIRSTSLIVKDLKAKQFSLIYVDIMYGIYNSIKHTKSYIRTLLNKLGKKL